MNRPQLGGFNASFMRIEELEARLAVHGDPILATKVLDAFEMARSVHEFQYRNDGTPHFYHSTRVARCMMDELGIYDSDMLIASMLHDVIEDSDTITKAVLDYNFGSYVAYLVEVLTKDLSRVKQDPEGVDIAHAEKLRASGEDPLIIKLASRLDNFRCLGYNLKRNPLVYIRNTTERYLPLADATNNKHLRALADAIRKESNKFLG